MRRLRLAVAAAVFCAVAGTAAPAAASPIQPKAAGYWFCLGVPLLDTAICFPTIRA